MGAGRGRLSSGVCAEQIERQGDDLFAATTPPQRAVVIPEIESKIIVSVMGIFQQLHEFQAVIVLPALPILRLFRELQARNLAAGLRQGCPRLSPRLLHPEPCRHPN
jgi:hypothetical protein